MPDLISHQEAATRNQIVLNCLLTNYDNSPNDFVHWVITVAFYKALHLVEGIFYVDGLTSKEKRAFHSKDHQERNQRLKSNKRFEHLWRHYRPLWEASMVARYLFDVHSGRDQTDLQAYLPEDSIRSKFIGHHLKQIEKTFEVKTRK
jgi:hypothetical protein